MTTVGSNPTIRVKITPATVEGVEELHVSAAPGAAPVAQARAVYEAIISELKDPSSLRIVAERAFGCLKAMPGACSVRGQVFANAGLDTGNPVTWIECSPVEGASLAGVQLTLVREGPAARIEPLECEGHRCGAVVTTGALKRAWLSSMHGIQAGYSPEAQAALMFERGEKVLASAGLTWHNVVCTRIYMKRLLEWYKEFNGVRNLFYRKLGLIGDGRYDVPSSTGIQGKMSDDCECVMDIFAASKSPGKPAFRKLHNPLQSEATDYGSSFARGARVDFGDAAYVFISGTASIDGKGKSVFVGDPAAQSRQTMDSFESVLKAGGGGISDLVQGTCFCKDASYAGAMEQEMLRRGWPEFPWPMVVADVCRHDLLVEIDGAAVTTGTR